MKKLKHVSRDLRAAFNHKSLQYTTGAMAAVVAGSAAADETSGSDIPGADGMSDAFSSIQSSATDMIENAWPVLIAITGGFILMKLGKRAMRSAT